MSLPDYGGGSIVNLMASLQRGLGGEEHDYAPLRLLPPPTVAAHRQVVLWIIDGLGFHHLCRRRDATALHRHLLGGIDSVYPPTTAAAITTFLTGDAPQQHGLTGWHLYLRELGAVLAVLPGRPRYGGGTLAQAGIDPGALFAHRPFAARITVETYHVAPYSIADSDFNRAHLGGARLRRYRDLDGLLARCSELLEDGKPKFVYAYWPELDSIGHREGIDSDAAHAHLLQLDRAFARLAGQIQGSDTLLLVCADHGQIDTTAATRLQLQDHPQLGDMLALPLCGEPRSTYCYLRAGCSEAFDAYVSRAFAGKARNFDSRALLEGGWFGLGEPHPELRWRIGDRVLLWQDNYSFKDWLAQEERHELVGVHGGLSEAERRVPLLLSSGRGAPGTAPG